MDTGRAGTIYGQSRDSLLGISFFIKHGLMPDVSAGYRLEALHTFPTPDFQNLGAAATFGVNKSIGDISGAVNLDVRSNIGWNFGADKAKALFVVGNVHSFTRRAILLLNDGQPNTSEFAGAKSVGFRGEITGSVYDLGRTDSANGWNNAAGWTQLATVSTILYTVIAGEARGMALYVDTSGGVVKAFLRVAAAQWVEVMSISNSHLAAVRCATLAGHPNGGGSLIPHQIFGTPVGIYAGA